MTRQGERHILHLLHYVPERRGLNLEIVEDGMPVLPATVRVRVKASKAFLVPSGDELQLVDDGDGVLVELPGFVGHAHVSLE